MANVLRMLQQNISSCEKVTDEIRILALDEDVDIVALHEPFNPNGKIKGFHMPIAVITGNEEGETALAAIALCNSKFQVAKVEDLCNDRCICILLNTDIGDVFLISMYSPVSEPIEHCLKHFGLLLEILEDKQIIICIDANAKSLWWSGSTKTDERGEKLEDFIIANSLCVVNRKDPIDAMPSKGDRSDLTLVTHNIVQRITEWQAMDDWTTGGNRTIGMEVNFQNFDEEAFKECIEQVEQEMKVEQEDYICRGDENVEALTEENVRVMCEYSKNVKVDSYPWWNDHLNHLRQKVSKAKRKLEKEIEKEAKMSLLKDNYLKMKKIYGRAVRKVKGEYYKNLRLERNGLDPEWNVIEGEQHLFDFEVDNSVTSFEGSTTNWDEYKLSPSIDNKNESEGDNEIQSNV